MEQCGEALPTGAGGGALLAERARAPKSPLTLRAVSEQRIAKWWPLQCSRLESPWTRAWRATVQGVTGSDAPERLNNNKITA